MSDQAPKSHAELIAQDSNLDSNKLLEALLEAGPEAHAQRETSHLPESGQRLFAAIDSGNANECLRLLDEGADPNSYSNYTGRSAMSASIEKELVPVVKKLIDKGAYLNPDIDGDRPLEGVFNDRFPHPAAVAAKVGNFEIFDEVVKRGSSPVMGTYLGERAFMWAAKQPENKEILDSISNLLGPLPGGETASENQARPDAKLNIVEYLLSQEGSKNVIEMDTMKYLLSDEGTERLLKAGLNLHAVDSDKRPMATLEEIIRAKPSDSFLSRLMSKDQAESPKPPTPGRS